MTLLRVLCNTCGMNRPSDGFCVAARLANSRGSAPPQRRAGSRPVRGQI